MGTKKYARAPAGAGKTTACCLRTIELVGDDKHVLFVQPTKELIAKTKDQITYLSPFVSVHVIHGDTHAETVVSKVTSHLQKPPREAHVLFITWSAFERLPYVHDPARWHLIIDEVPQVFRTDQLRVPKTHGLLTQHVELAPTDSEDSYRQLIVSDPAEVRAIAENRHGDRAIEVFRGLARTLHSRHWSTYVDAESYKALIAHSGQRKALTTFSILNPSIVEQFASVTMVGALFEETILYKLWPSRGAQFRIDQDIGSKLRFTEHQNGDLITISYAFDRPWSKSFRDKDNGNAWNLLVSATEKWMAGQPSIWMANKDAAGTLFPSPPALRLPNAPHGLNDFQHVHDAAVLSALNPTPADFNFLNSRGISSDEVRTAISCHAAYQAVMRSSIRNPDDASPKRVLVPDRATAEWLSKQFPGSRVESLGLAAPAQSGSMRPPGRPRMHASDAERKRASRNRGRQELSEDFERIASASSLTTTSAEAIACAEVEDSNSCDETPIEQHSHFVTRFHGTIYDHKSATTAFHIISGYAINDFIKLLKTLHQRTVSSKNQNRLISPALYVSTQSTTARGRGSPLYATGIWLDNDGGDLTHAMLASLLPQVRMVAFNTYSSTKLRPRYRVYVPLSEAVRPQHYRTIVTQILALVRGQGFKLQKPDSSQRSIKAHGFDASKGNASDLLFLPCQALDPKDSFFTDYKYRRTALNVQQWLARAVQPQQPQQPARIVDGLGIGAPSREPEIAKLVDHWRSVGSQPGNGDRGLFELGTGLRRLGLDDQSIKDLLEAEAHKASTPADRLCQVPRIIRSLQRHQGVKRRA